MKKKKETKLEWEDVGEEFKRVFYNIGKALNNALEGEKKRKKRLRERVKIVLF